MEIKRKERKERKRNEKKERGKNRKKEREKEKGVRKREEAGRFFLNSPAFQWSELVGLRTKASLLDEGYEYVLKSKGFIEDLVREI